MNFCKGLLSYCLKNLCKLISCCSTLIKRFRCCEAEDESHADSRNGGKSNRNIDVLWFQYYKLYVTEYEKGDSEKIVIDENISNDHHETVTVNKDNSDDKTVVPCFCCVAYAEEAKDSVTENCS